MTEILNTLNPAETLRYAIDLAQFLPVFPCLADKRPACPHGFHDATKTLIDIERLWRDYPGPLIGVPTGASSGFDVLDIDVRAGGDQWWEANLELLPRTRCHETLSGGWHAFFRHVEGVRNNASKIAPGIDVRGDGGYVCWWPAVGLAIDERDTIAEWPAWLLEKMQRKTLQLTERLAAWGEWNRTAIRNPEQYAAAALENAVGAVTYADEGTRNDRLNRETFELCKLIRVDFLSLNEVVEAMTAAALEAGLTEYETERTIMSALRAGEVIEDERDD